ncbi:vacuolar protein sorting-associated protein-like protein vps5 [Phyllosticta citrichinensis]|uniref:Vacuolar protein sorting-associated protein-like protein vps5 n=1 Tax=Phyllosticta citrichinensis TaxID=1130410 RepID=A0ABR1XMP6_9PEZI
MDLHDDPAWGDVPSNPLRTNSVQDVPQITTDQPDADQANNSAAHNEPTSSTTASKATRSPGRPKPNRRIGVPQPTRLETVDDPLGPLGASADSLNDSQADEPPVPPQKELAAGRGSRPATATSQGSLRSMMDSVNLGDEADARSLGARIPPPVQPASNNGPPRQHQPSVSVEQAAKPTFNISVGDPHKVGDLTSSHTEYAVKTVTTSKAYRNPEFTVSRRYRDFLWLYNQLHNNNPGIVVPPPPEKQAVGRFDADFVESRRQALERMLNKCAAHPILQHDGDLKLFLESEAFNVDIKHKERKDPLLTENKGMLGSLGLSVNTAGKFIEHDDWFHDRKVYLDALETQLKGLLKATDTVVEQRKSLAAACGDFSASLHSLASVELSPSLSEPLDGLSELQLRIRELYDRQAQQDVLTLGIVIDEYIRLVGSVKMAFQQRQKSYHAWHVAESELQKRRATQEKLLRQGRSQQDRLNQLSADVADAERKSNQARLLFEDMGRLMRNELERFEREKVEDFKSGVETYLESAVEAQKELIEIWETYLMQLDAEEEGAPFGATSPPAGIKATDFPGGEQHSDSRPTTAQSEDTHHHHEEADDRPVSAGSSQ